SALLGIALTLFCTFYTGAPTVDLGVGVLDTATHLVDFGFAKLNAATCGILFSFVVMALSWAFLPSR
ncbi:MAG: sodium:solute symporter family protein, partial [Fretibacterium sp.]|nr:sodium:solute symporter family protein [Fretibacterium sp.]